MEPPTTKAEILARNAAARESWLETIAGLSDAELLAPNAVDGWSVRDIIAHLGLDNRWFAAQLTALLEGRAPTAVECHGVDRPPPPGIDMATQDGRNAYGQWLMAGASLEDVRALEQDSAARRDAVLATIPDGDFGNLYTIKDVGHIGRIEPAAEGEWSSPLWRWAMGNGWHHYEDHTASVVALSNRRA